MNTVIIIQARMSSTRLQGKVLMKIADHPMLYFVFTRASKAKVSKVIVATSNDLSDDSIVDYCTQQNFPVIRGNLNNVLDRFYHAAKHEKADVVIRVTADCPLIDGDLITQGLIQFEKEKPDYLSNTIRRTYPRGFDFEIFTFAALEFAYQNAKTQFEYEHVTPFIWKSQPEKFNIKQLTQKGDKSNYRLTVDTPDDLELVKELLEKYHAEAKNCAEIIGILDSHSELFQINAHIKQKHIGL